MGIARRGFTLALSMVVVACVGDTPVAVVPDSGNPADTGTADSGPVDAAPEADAPGLYVSATTGNDANPGSKAQPLKTLKKALSLAKSGDAVRLLPGTYDESNGETYPETVPDGVGITGTTDLDAGTGATLASTTKANGLVFAGGGGVGNVTLTGFNTGLAVTTGTQTFGPLSVSASVAAVAVVLDASGTAKPTVLGTSVVGANVVFNCAGTASLTIDKVVSPAPAAAGRFLVAADGCTAKVTNGTIAGSGNNAITLNGTSSVALDTTTIDQGHDGIDSASATTLNLKGGAITNVTNDGISGGGAITVDGTTFSGAGRMGIEQSSGSLNVKNSVFSGNAQGNVYSQAASVVLRACTLKNSPFGLSILGAVTLDMGTTNAPGNNVCSGISSTCLDVSLGSSSTYDAKGNTWIFNTQGADSAGKYAAGVNSGTLYAGSIPLSGKNYKAKSDNSQKIYLGL